MRRYVVTAVAALLMAVAGCAAAPKQRSFTQIGQDAHIRVGTLAPKRSFWGKLYTTWAREVADQTRGRIQIDMFFNGVRGNEASMISNMRSGDLDAAMLTSSGLGQINRDVLVLELPGVVSSWSDLARVRGEIEGQLLSGFGKSGFRVALWSDLGPVQICTRDFQAHQPVDLIGRTVGSLLNDPMELATLAAIEKVHVLGVSAVAPSRMDVAVGPVWALASSPALACHYLAEPVWSYSVGALVTRYGAVEELPPDLRTVLEASLGRLSRAIRERVDTTNALELSKLTRVACMPSDCLPWKSLFRKVANGAGDRGLDRALVNKVLGLQLSSREIVVGGAMVKNGP